jgi:multicomponent Na+:H+ antiporter subunit C
MLEGYNYWMSVLLMMIGFFGVIARGNLVKKMMGLAIFQMSVLLFYISLGNVKGGTIPVIKEGVTLYVNPIPHVLMLTAIVVGVAVMAVGLALIVRIREAYGTIEEDEIIALDVQLNNQENAK